MLPGDSAPYGGAVIGPVRNGWVAEAGQMSTTVYAGGQGYGHTDEGLFLISRQGQAPRTDRIPVPQAGAIKITSAPLGRKVVSSAQKNGKIHFTSTNGVTGTLSLGDDTVTLDRPRTATSRGYGTTKMSNNPHCELPGSSEYFWPERNLWRADTKRRITIVCAGGAGSDKPGAGRFLIIRSGRGWPKSLPGIDQVDVDGVGPIKITAAPRGPNAATLGQLHGIIEFRAAHGATGTLHLRDDTVTQNP
jgi:hypothetical protein